VSQQAHGDEETVNPPAAQSEEQVCSIITNDWKDSPMSNLGCCMFAVDCRQQEAFQTRASSVIANVTTNVTETTCQAAARL